MISVIIPTYKPSEYIWKKSHSRSSLHCGCAVFSSDPDSGCLGVDAV